MTHFRLVTDDPLNADAVKRGHRPKGVPVIRPKLKPEFI
jgi:hypothetical protein